MKIDAEIPADPLSDMPLLSRRAEEYGFDCLWVNETKHDPFVQLALAASQTRAIAVGSSVALAFTRSPTALAYAAWDLQALSKGRLLLGLGSQVKGHIERRFGAKWESPAPRMREVILAMKAVWECWQKGTKLDFQGRFFKLDLMTPFFNPGPIASPAVPVFVAGVNGGMCRVAGEVGDGLLVHPLHTAGYLKEVIAPALSVGLAKHGRRRGDVAVAASVFAAVGERDREIKKAKNQYRRQVAFYASTRTYRRVMELHGWGDVCDRLHALSVKGEWDKMAEEVTDDILDEFVVEGTWEEMGGVMRRRYGDAVDRVRLYLPFDGDEKWKALVGGFRA
ncbi:MAG TPA: TIGR03617 family F420-dependent LLM class oxidoreductase [Nitrososphaerales archaeon]|nr:TIGR03617 family F420-dependent LLM class oxidoreductase [Nitrososphaerales archaeon]